jgi:cardiolipin synthase
VRLHRDTRWLAGNSARLLENGEAYFPAVFDAIRSAGHEVILETFLVFEDKVGLELHAALLEAAQRGVQVDVLVDGFGAADLGPAFIDPLVAAGVRLRSFDPGVRWFGQRLNVLRRMHRKLVVVDGRVAFVGGINYSADHLADFGPEAKQDYAVELQGPIVEEIRRFVVEAIAPAQGARPGGWPLAARSGLPAAASAGSAQAIFVRRDNHGHRNDIERHYRAAIRSARRRVLIANAYFLPGYRLLHELRRAARRGVAVHLILQGKPDMPIARTAATLLYEPLLRDGVRIHEYCERPLHGKVAVVDDDWSTVGSSNLDPLSLSLNLEANVVLRDRGFAATLSSRLEHLMAKACHEVTADEVHAGHWWSSLAAFVLFHVLRHFPRWAAGLPDHAPRLVVPTADPASAAAAAAAASAATTPATATRGTAHAR